jgi:hypothetical protein
MIKRVSVLLIAAAAVCSLASTSFGQRRALDPEEAMRTANQAKAMLAKAVAAVKADKAKALDMFNKGEGGFRDGNLYVFCVDRGDGKFVATGNPNAKQFLGVDERTIKDIDGTPLNLEEAAQKPDGEITTIDFEWPRPGPDKVEVPKENYITKVKDLICGVGYYYWKNERGQ